MSAPKPNQVRARIRVDRDHRRREHWYRRRGVTAAAHYGAVPVRYMLGVKR